MRERLDKTSRQHLFDLIKDWTAINCLYYCIRIILRSKIFLNKKFIFIAWSSRKITGRRLLYKKCLHDLKRYLLTKNVFFLTFAPLAGFCWISFFNRLVFSLNLDIIFIHVAASCYSSLNFWSKEENNLHV